MRNKNWVSRMLSSWPAKVLSLAAALLLFFFYRLNRLEDRYISVPLSVSMNDEFVPASEYPRAVRITLRGESNSLFKIQEGDIHAALDLSGFRSEGVFRVPVQIEKLGSALGVDPLEIKADPGEVAVGMERRVSKTVPITPSFRGFLEPGFELVAFDFVPPEVEIYGPARAVGRVADVTSDFIELTGRNADFAVRIRLLKKESLVNFSGADSVEFRAVVQKSLAVRIFPSLEIAVRGLPDGLQLATPLPKGWVGVRSSNSDISGFAPGPDTLSVDLTIARKPGSYTIPVTAWAPEGYVVERFEPRSLTVVLEARKEF